MDAEERIAELERRIDRLEKVVTIHEEHIKEDILSGLQEKDTLKKLEEKIDFIDEKHEHRHDHEND